MLRFYRPLTKSEVAKVKERLKSLGVTVKSEYAGSIQVNTSKKMTVRLAKQIVKELEKIDFIFLGYLTESMEVFLALNDDQELSKQFFRGIFAK